MLKSIKLTNFQSHKNTTLDFLPGVNVISGASDNGKTAIIRALSWVNYNRPLGTQFISDWAKDEKDNIKDDCIVEIESDSGVVSRKKTKDKNVYEVNGSELAAVGTSVPDSVTKFFNFSDVNFQKQLDSPFLLMETPGNIAKFFNELVNLDDIDSFLSAIDSKKRKTNRDKKEISEKIQATENELKKYSWIPEAKEKLKQVEEIETELNKITLQKNHLQTLLPTVKKDLELIENMIDIPRAEKLIACLGETVFDIEEKNNKIKSLEYSVKQLQLIPETIKNIDFEQGELIINRVNILSEKIAGLENQINYVNGLTHTLGLTGIDLKRSQKNIELLEKDMPDTCPLCGGNMEKKHG